MAHNLGIINFKIAIFKMFRTMLTTTGYNDLAILSSIVPPLALVLVSYIETPFPIMSSCCVAQDQDKFTLDFSNYITKCQTTCLFLTVLWVSLMLCEIQQAFLF